MKYLSEEGELVRSESRVQGERGGSAPVEDALVNVLGALDRPEAARVLHRQWNGWSMSHSVEK